MFNQLKRKSVLKKLPIAIVLMLLGMFVLVLEWGDLASIMRGPVAFETVQPDEFEPRMIVEASIDANFGFFAEEYEENTETHETKSQYYYYVVWTGDENAEDWRYMGIKVPASDYEAMEAMAEDTYNYGYSENVIEYAGCIDEMTDEEYQYFREYFTESGFTDEEIDAYTLPYYINVGVLVGGSETFTYFLIAVGVLMVLGGILMLILAANKSITSLKKDLAGTNFSKEDAEQDYADAKVFGKKGDVRIGRRMMFYMQEKKPHIAVNNDIVWAYISEMQRTGGALMFERNYEVVMYTYKKKIIHMEVGGRYTGEDILHYMNEMMPWIVTGYNDELNRMYFSDYTGFLQLKFQNANPGTTYFM